MERRCIRHRHLRAAAQPGYGRRADRHVYRGHFERSQRRGCWCSCAGSGSCCWLRAWRSRLGCRR
jgi:hypothetical protein